MASKKALLAMACCKLYVSESRNPQALEAIAAIPGRASEARLIHTFTDSAYNRVGYTLVAALHNSSCPPLHNLVLEMVRTAFCHIDLRQHSGTHPRLGVVDHVCFHPLGVSTSLQSVVPLATALARDIGSNLALPTYLYGAAHPEGRPLHSIRRDLGYFSSDGGGQWTGAALSSQQLPVPPDFGPECAPAKTGVVVIGACPWIANYNIPLLSTDLQVGRRIARRVSTRGGGLPGVQCMALLHGPSKMEIACNLTDCSVTSADLVQEEVIRLAEREGIVAEAGYFTDYSEDQITEMAHQVLGGGEGKSI